MTGSPDDTFQALAVRPATTVPRAGGEIMSDGDHYGVCCSCGTEYLERAMRRVTDSGLFMCGRCEVFDRGEAYPDDDGFDPEDD